MNDQESSSTSNEKKPSQPSYRSREAIQRRNKKRHQKMKTKQQQYLIKREIHQQWTISQIKQYLHLLNIRYGRIQQIYNNILRLQFSNQHDQDLAQAQIGIDISDENHYQNYINNQQS